MVKNFYLGIAIMITVFFGSNLFAQLPSSPISLNADISFNGTDYEMILAWQAGASHTMTDLFNVYIATGNTEEPVDFMLSSTLTRDGDSLAVYTYSHTFTATGEYSVYITGQNGFGEGPASEFLHFHTGPAIISGWVKIQSQELPIGYADVTIKAMVPHDTTYFYYTTANDSGYFEIEVPDGNYKVFVGGDYCLDMWYQGAETEEQATDISAKYGYRTEIIIESVRINWENITGTVKEKGTGYPIYSATVDFMAYKGEKLIKIFSVQTDNDGSYSINLSQKYYYKIFAYDNFTPRKYIPMYYFNTYDYLESEIFIVDSTSEQPLPNFILEEYPASLNKINGVVKDNLGNGVKSMLILYKHQMVSGVRTIESDEEGNFTFKNLEPGKYIIRAIPKGNYTSGFYNTNDYVEPHWFDATLINVNENTEYNNYLIVVKPIIYPEGNYSIEFSVMEDQNSIEGKKEKVQEEIYIKGAVTYLLNSKMETVAFDYFGYKFENLASDHYTLKVDKIGYEFYTSDDIYVNEIDTFKLVKVYLNKHPHTNPTISFISTPPHEAFVGQSYSYDAEAVTNSNDSIRYDLIESPEGMSVDGQTGLILWVPSKEGSFTVTLEAYLLNNPNVTIQQTWIIEVNGGISTGYLKVFVQNDEQQKFPDATLKLYSSDFSSTFTSVTNSLGEAFFALPSGDYYLNLSGDLFEDCWYNNKNDLNDADVISVTLGDTLEIYCMVTNKQFIYEISGIVADSESPIPDASVHFILETGEIRSVQTAANGRFSFEIGKDTAFRAFAVKDNQYTAQFYPSYYDFAEAPIQKNISSAMFDFINLEPLPKSTVNIEGKILDESALPLPGVVVAYGGDFVDDGTAVKFKVDFINSAVAKDGNYSLSVPISGNYILRAYPADESYYPAYYSDDVEPKYSWERGKVIEATGDLIKDIFIKTKRITPTSGNGEIGGKVEMIIFNLMNFAYSQISPIGVTVFAVDQSDKICKYTFTNNGNGNYYLDNLVLSKWKVVAEKIGLTDESAQQTLTLTESNQIYDDVILFYSFGSSVAEEAFKVMSVYPNPAGSVINIVFREDNMINSNINVLDNLGNERISFDSSNSNVSVDISSLTSGVYFFRVSRGTKFYTMPFVKLND